VTSEKPIATVKPRGRGGRFFVFAFFALGLSACGFHLRGNDMAFPPSLSQLRVTVRGAGLNDPLWITMRDTLANSAHVAIVADPGVPQLTLFDERSKTQVLSVDETGHARGYTLQYEVSFKLDKGDGTEWIAPQTIQLARDYSFDPLNLLAKEREKSELRQTLQREAVQQIVRRLARTAAKGVK
jgi:LPS-assembly lipoprotein